MTKEERETKRREREEKRRLAKAEKEARRAERLRKAAERNAEKQRKEHTKLKARAEYLANWVELVVKASGKVIARFNGVRDIQLPAATQTAIWLSRRHGSAILSGDFNNQITGESYRIFKEYEQGVESWMR